MTAKTANKHFIRIAALAVCLAAAIVAVWTARAASAQSFCFPAFRVCHVKQLVVNPDLAVIFRYPDIILGDPVRS